MEFLREKVAQTKLTKKEVLVADYILKNANRVCFMSTKELASVLATSDATVNRLAKSIGFASFLELQKKLRERISRQADDAERFRMSPLERMFRAENPVKGQSSSFAEEFMKKSARNLESVFLNNDPAKLERVVELLLNSRLKYISGQRPTAALAGKFGFLLRMIVSNVIVVNSEYSFEQLLDISRKDCLFTIDFNQYSSTAAQLLQYARERRAPAVLLTDRMTSPLSHYATEVLAVDVDGLSFFNSNVAPLMLLEYICTRLAERASQNTKQRLNLLNPYFDSHKLIPGKK